jgi:hypothetical protein
MANGATLLPTELLNKTYSSRFIPSKLLIGVFFVKIIAFIDPFMYMFGFIVKSEDFISLLDRVSF